MPNLDLWPMLQKLEIRTKGGKRVKLDRNAPFAWAQREFVAEVERQYNAGLPVRIIVLKGRQLGISTVTEAILFLWSFIHPNSYNLVLSKQKEDSKYLFTMTKRYWTHGPFFDLFTLKYDTKEEMVWDAPLESTVRVATATADEVGRGMTIQSCHCSEVAFWGDQADTIIPGLENAIPYEHGTIWIHESTAQGVGGYFHDEWMGATDPDGGKSDFVPMFFPWFWHDEYAIADHQLSYEDLERDGEFGDEHGVLRFLLDEGVSADGVIAKLAWRRRKIRNAPKGIDGFHEEYPCVIGSTRIGTVRGMVPISEVAVGDLATLGRVTITKRNAPSPVFRLQTVEGYSFTGTANHPVQTRDGFVDLGTLAARTRVALMPPQTSHSLHVERWNDHGIDCSLTVTEEWGRLLGFFMGDGSLYKDAISIVCDAKDDDVVDDVVKLLWTTMGLEAQTRQVGSKKGGTEVRVSSMRARKLMQQLGLTRTNTSGSIKRDVKVPDLIWRSPAPVVREFLRGYFEADGNNCWNAARVSAFSATRGFLEDVQLLLLGFGVTSVVRSRNKRSGDYTYVGHELTMNGDQARAFVTEIGFVGGRKQAIITPEARPTGRPCTRNEMWATVESVEPAGEEETYDITVAGAHTFDANGILTHNCTPEEAFLSTGSNVFPLPELMECYKPHVGRSRGYLYNNSGKIGFHETDQGHWTVFKHPGARQKYVVACDPTRTIEGDPACIQVLNRATMEQVAVWHGSATGSQVGEIALAAGYYYNNALLNTEIQGGGREVMQVWRDAGYNNIWYDRRPDKTRRSTATLGWNTTYETKQWLIGTAQGFLKRREVVIHHGATYYEMTQYTALEDGTFGPARRSGHDDCVMAYGIAIITASTEWSTLGMSEIMGQGLGPPDIGAHRIQVENAARPAEIPGLSPPNRTESLYALAGEIDEWY